MTCTMIVWMVLYKYHILTWFDCPNRTLSGHDFHANVLLCQYGVVYQHILCNDHGLLVTISLHWSTLGVVIVVNVKDTQQVVIFIGGEVIPGGKTSLTSQSFTHWHYNRLFQCNHGLPAFLVLLYVLIILLMYLF